MLKSSMTKPGAVMLIWGRMSVRYIDAKPGTMVTVLAQRAAWPYFIRHWVTAYSRDR